MIPLLIISSSIIGSGFLGGILGYKCYSYNNRNKKNVSFNTINDYENNNSSILKSPSLSSPDNLNIIDLYNNYDKIQDKNL